MKIEILGTPFNGLGPLHDTENPADGLRQANLIPLLKNNGHSVSDLGDLSEFQFQEIRDLETGIKDFNLWIELSKSISKTLGGMLDRKSFPLLLGGDCSMLVGILSAFVERKMEIGLMFLDGHADFHSPETSESGDPADMELAIVTGHGPDRITRITNKYPLINEEHVVVCGIRAWDNIANSNIRVIDSKRLLNKGIRDAAKEGVEHFRQKDLSLWLHFDVDVLDPELMPVMFPEPGGLTFEETQEFLSVVWTLGHVAGMSIACYHPNIDIDRIAGIRLAKLLSEVLSSERDIHK